ncbi:hypothetical protein MBLNU457_7463t1 [Dothideomycetes sp. NU457]
MATLFGSLYNTLFRSNTIMLGTVFASAFAIEIGFETLSNGTWDMVNRGRQWKDIKQKYLQKDDDDDE